MHPRWGTGQVPSGTHLGLRAQSIHADSVSLDAQSELLPKKGQNSTIHQLALFCLKHACP